MKIRFGMLATDAFGKAGGQCIQRRGSIRVLRNITIPTIRDASISNPQRLLNSRLFNRWAFLPKAVRDEWAIVGNNLSRINGWGESKNLSGREAFTSINSLLFPYSGTFLDPSTISYEIPYFTMESILLKTSTEELIFDAYDIGEVQFFQIKVLQIRSNAVNPLIPKLKTFVRPSDLGDPEQLFTELKAVYPNITPGQWFAFAVRGISPYGIPSTWQTLTVQAVL